MKIPEVTVKRLNEVLGILEHLQTKNIKRVSSSMLGKHLGVSSNIVRKDISYLLDQLPDNLTGESNLIGEPGAGYSVDKLKNSIKEALGLTRTRKTCIVGLGKLGLAILNHPMLAEKGFEVVAGFEKSINKIETIKTPVNIYPSYMTEEIVKEKKIEIGIIAVPEDEAEDVKKSLIRGGIKGILNFSSCIISSDNEEVIILNLDIISNLRFISALLQVCTDYKK